MSEMHPDKSIKNELRSPSGTPLEIQEALNRSRGVPKRAPGGSRGAPRELQESPETQIVLE